MSNSVMSLYMEQRDYINRSHLRLRTIVRLRWIAIVGQFAAVLLVFYWLKFEFPLTLTIFVICLSVCINVVLSAMVTDIKVLGNQFGTWMLGFDIIQLSVLLYLTGGILNPFASLLVAPIAISAASLRTQSTLTLSILAIVSASIISFVYLPLPWETVGGLEFPVAYRLGNWISLLCAMAFIGFFAWRIANESRVMSAALAATEATLAREQKLSAIDGLAAAAAHGLGTPLSTICLVAKELERELPDENHIKDDVKLIRRQAVRCREILQSLTDEGMDADMLVASSSLGDVIEEVAQPLKALNANIIIKKSAKAGTVAPYDKEPLLYRNPGMIYALGNIVENAVEFSKNQVLITIEWSETKVKLNIVDDGPGFSPEMMKILGEPFVSSRSIARGEVEDHQSGMGLGFFISKTLLERSGAIMRFGNVKHDLHKGVVKGAYVKLEWPRSALDTSIEKE